MAFFLACGALAMAGAASAAELGIGETAVNGTLFIDASHIDATANGARSAASGDGMDMKRFYFNVEHRFSGVWSARVNTDVNWLRRQDPTDVYFKFAYLEGKFSKAFALRLGTAPMPWIAVVNQWYGYRYLDSDLLMRAKVGQTGDWGVHTLGSVGPGIQYAVAAVTGAGYKEPRLGNGPDVEARVSWQPSAHTILAVGGYEGTLAQDVDARRALHTARRVDVMAAYADARFRLGGQWYRTYNWGQVLKEADDRGRGWSAWASMQVTPQWALFARRDVFKASLLLQPGRVDRYTNAGVEWRAASWLRLAAVWKRNTLTDRALELKASNEAGIWAQISY